MPAQRSGWTFALVASIGWFALIAQYIIMLQNRTVSPFLTTIRFFSFFTILTNLLLAAYCTFMFLRRPKNVYIFFERPGVLTAITIYMLVVGSVYQLVLRPVWDPQGLQKWVDELLHSVQPVLGLIAWFLHEQKQGVRKAPFLQWLIYPLVYLVWILFVGALSGFYPYPFVNVPQLGYGKVFLHCGAVVLLFLLLMLIFRTLAGMFKKEPWK
ncbi:MAG: Pr6Pr family membrane protein [Chitinophagales bacterium]